MEYCTFLYTWHRSFNTLHRNVSHIHLHLLLVVIDLVSQSEALFQELLTAFGVYADALRVCRRHGVSLKDAGHVMQQPCSREHNGRVAVFIGAVK